MSDSMIRFTANLDSFATAVSNVALFAGTDDTLPVLTNVEVTARGNTVTLAATDRYVLAVTDYTLPDDNTAEGSGRDGVGTFLLTPEMVKALDAQRRAAKRMASRTPVIVTWHSGDGSLDDTVCIDVAYGATQTFRAAQHTWGGFPKWRNLLPVSHARADVDSFAYNPAFIGKMAKMRPAPAHVKLSPGAGRDGSGIGATRWQAGDLYGLIMPVRLDDSSPVVMRHAAAPAVAAA